MGGVGEGVAQDQAAFGIGVEDFDGGAVHSGYDVAGLVGGGIGHVFAGGGDGDEVDGQFGAGGGNEGADYAGGAAHVEFHFVHFSTGLEGNAAAVEGYAFAYQNNGRGVFIGRAEVGKLDEARLLGAAFGYRPERTHVFADVVGAEDFGRRSGGLGFGAGGIGQIGGGADVAGGVAEVFAQIDAVQQGLGAAECISGGLVGGGGVEIGLLQGGGFGGFFEAVEPVYGFAQRGGEHTEGIGQFGGGEGAQVDGERGLLLYPTGGVAEGFGQRVAPCIVEFEHGGVGKAAVSGRAGGGEGFAFGERAVEQGGGFIGRGGGAQIQAGGLVGGKGGGVEVELHIDPWLD